MGGQGKVRVFQASQDYIVRPCLKNKQKIENKVLEKKELSRKYIKM